MRRIVILDPGGEPARNVGFLLRMAGYLTFPSCSALEAANLILNRSRAAEPIELVVVNNWRTIPELKEMSVILESAGAPVPFLIVRRKGDPAPSPPAGSRLCSPSELLKEIEELFDSPSSSALP